MQNQSVVKKMGRVLKEMGYEDGYARFEEYVEEITSADPSKYLELLRRVDELENQPESENKKGGVCVGNGFHLGLILHCTRLFKISSLGGKKVF